MHYRDGNLLTPASLSPSLSNETVVLMNPGLGDRLISSATDQLITAYEEPEEAREQPVQWATAEGKEHEQGYRLVLTHPKVTSHTRHFIHQKFRLKVFG